jgi:hypothetical protein
MNRNPLARERLDYLRKQMKEKLGWEDEELDGLSPEQ